MQILNLFKKQHDTVVLTNCAAWTVCQLCRYRSPIARASSSYISFRCRTHTFIQSTVRTSVKSSQRQEILCKCCVVAEKKFVRSKCVCGSILNEKKRWLTSCSMYCAVCAIQKFSAILFEVWFNLTSFVKSFSTIYEQKNYI